MGSPIIEGELHLPNTLSHVMQPSKELSNINGGKGGGATILQVISNAQGEMHYGKTMAQG